ncbi:MAG: hypothetical protein AAGA64_16770 [Bacteroidota bacterium]
MSYKYTAHDELRDDLSDEVKSGINSIAHWLKCENDLAKGNESEFLTRLIKISDFDDGRNTARELALDMATISSRLKTSVTLDGNDVNRLQRLAINMEKIGDNLQLLPFEEEIKKNSQESLILLSLKDTHGQIHSFKDLSLEKKELLEDQSSQFIHGDQVHTSFMIGSQAVWEETIAAASKGVFNGADTSKGRGSSFNRT